MYNEQERNNILNKLVEQFNNRPEILSVIQVGSGAIGYKDRYSDLDLVVVIDNSNISDVFKKTNDDIRNLYDIFYVDNMENNNLQLFLLNNYLEIDIGYYTLETLYARRQNYKVIFDKTNKVEEIMTKSWLELKDKNKGTTGIVNMNDIIKYIDKELWYNVIHSVVSFKRNNIYKSYYELDQIRNYVIDLIAKRNNKESKRYRSINELDKEELAKINYLFKYPNTYEELSVYLEKSIITIFNEFEYWRTKEDIKYNGNKDFYLNYIKINK